MQLALLGEPAATWFLFIVVDPLLLGAWVWLVLRLFGKTERFLQTATAVFGTGAVLGLALYLPLQLIATAVGQEPSSRPGADVRAAAGGHFRAGHRAHHQARHRFEPVHRHRRLAHLFPADQLLVGVARGGGGLTMHLHILGICGTFMGGIAAIARAAGHRVTGSDRNVYPPMSTQLAALGIDVIEGYEPDQLEPAARTCSWSAT